MNERTLKLRQLMARHGIKAPEAAAIIGCQPHTVRVWRCRNGQTIPAATLRLLELELEVRAREAGK